MKILPGVLPGVESGLTPEALLVVVARLELPDRSEMIVVLPMLGIPKLDSMASIEVESRLSALDETVGASLVINNSSPPSLSP